MFYKKNLLSFCLLSAKILISLFSLFSSPFLDSGMMCPPIVWASRFHTTLHCNDCLMFQLSLSNSQHHSSRLKYSSHIFYLSTTLNILRCYILWLLVHVQLIKKMTWLNKLWYVLFCSKLIMKFFRRKRSALKISAFFQMFTCWY